MEKLVKMSQNQALELKQLVESTFLTGIARLDGRLVILSDLTEVLSSEEKTQAALIPQHAKGIR